MTPRFAFSSRVAMKQLPVPLLYLMLSAGVAHAGPVLPSAFDTLEVLVERFPCPALESLVETVMRTYRPRRSDSGNAATAVDRRWSDRVVPVLWSGASDKIAEAERIIGTTTR